MLNFSKSCEIATESLYHVMVGVGIPVAVHVNVTSSYISTLTLDAVLDVMAGFSVE